MLWNEFHNDLPSLKKHYFSFWLENLLVCSYQGCIIINGSSCQPKVLEKFIISAVQQHPVGSLRCYHP
ncbi:hypothetical protein SLE2022_041490 [Rubroshorea leprosula]